MTAPLTPPHPTAPVRLSRSEQAVVLASRYRAVLLGEPGTLLVILGQAPVLGGLCALVWGRLGSDSATLHFVLALCAVWLGCTAACREVVRERPVIDRERLLGVSDSAVILSKFKVLAVISALQVALLQGTVEWNLALRGPMLIEWGSLWLAGLAGVGLGLAVSALARTEPHAVGVVPLLLIPQLLFSELAIPRGAFGGAVDVIEELMPVAWCWRLFKAVAAPEPAWLDALGDLSVQVGMVGVLVGVAALSLKLTGRRT
jgi:hypothetical protein